MKFIANVPISAVAAVQISIFLLLVHQDVAPLGVIVTRDLFEDGIMSVSYQLNALLVQEQTSSILAIELAKLNVQHWEKTARPRPINVDVIAKMDLLEMQTEYVFRLINVHPGSVQLIPMP